MDAVPTTISEVVRFAEANPTIASRIELVRRERPYQIPKGYLPWRVMAALVGVALGVAGKEDVQIEDPASFFNAMRSSLWFLSNSPIYCLSKDLLRAFERTDFDFSSSLLKDLNPPLPTFLLLFPQNSVISPDGYPLDHLIVHLADRDHPDWSEAKGYGYSVPYLRVKDQRNLHFSGVSAEGTCWFGGSDLDSEGILTVGDSELGSTPMTSLDAEFTNYLRSVVVQCLLALTYRPDLLDLPVDPVQRGKGRAVQTARAKERFLSPRWLGKDYKPASSGAARGTHASPTAHWRRGHWRRAAVGARSEGQRKWTWIDPTFVGST